MFFFRKKDVFMRMKKKTVSLGYVRTGENKRVFEFILPASLPETIIHKYGQVKYTLSARMLGPKQFAPIKCEFYVRNCLDLSRCVIMRLPREQDASWSFCCGPCLSSPVNAQLILKRS